MNVKNLKALFIASRPPTLLAGIAPVLLGVCLSYSQSHTINNILVAILTLLSTLFMQIGTNLVNDYFDHRDGIDTTERLGPIRMGTKGMLTSNQIKKAFRISFILSFLAGIYLMFHGGIFIIILGFLSLLTAYCYTGGPYPLSRNALGEVTAFIFFGPIAVGGTYFLQESTLSYSALLFSVIPGSIAAAIMSINNLRDRKSDQKVKKRTIATLTNEYFARAMPIIFVIIAQFPIIYYSLNEEKHFALLLLILPLIFIKNWKSILLNPISEKLNFNLKITGLFLFISSIVTGFTLCL